MSELTIYQKWLPSVYEPTGNTTAIDVRRGMVAIPEVMSGLTKIESEIFKASAARQISEIGDKKLVEMSAMLFRGIAFDIGYTIPNQSEWQFIQSRILEVLKKYNGDLSLSEVHLAFELSAIGGLDSYLPKDKNGAPDRKHYQQFNIDYVSKIITAYRKKRKEVIAKAYSLLPKRPQQSNVPVYDKSGLYLEILRYKYTGILKFDHMGDEIVLHDILSSAGYIEEERISDEDRQKAYKFYLEKIAHGLVNRHKAAYIRSVGSNDSEMDDWSLIEKKRREIKKSLDDIIRNEYDIKIILK